MTITVPDLRQTTDFWDLSQRSVAVQRAGRYVPDQKNDPPELRAARTLPDVAGAVIDTYSNGGDLVVDLMAGTGVTLVVILKDFRKNKERVPLVDDTRVICEAAGWRYHDRAVLYLGRASQQQRYNAQKNGNLVPVTQTLLVFRKR